MKSLNTYCLLFLVALSADAQTRHQFSIHAGGGLSTFDYVTPAGNSTGRFQTCPSCFGGNLGADYTLFFGDTWGISTGLEAALFNGKYTLPAFNDAFPSYDGTESFEFRYALSRYSETQQAVVLNIPLMLRFERGWFYAAVGAKAGIRLGASYNNKADELAASGYYAQPNLTLHDPAFMGFGTFRDLHNEGEVALKTTLFASAEAGVKWGRGRLYTGLYLDYGLNDVNRATRTPGLVPYELPEPAAWKPRSVLAATAGGHNMADKLRLLAAGVKITFAIGESRAVGSSSSSWQWPVAVGSDSSIDGGRIGGEAVVETAAAQKAISMPPILSREEKARIVAEAQREAEAAQQAAEAQRQYDLHMQFLTTTIAGYPINIVTPTPSMKLKLDTVADILQRYPDLHVQIEGHTCNFGSDAVNMRIGQRRAEAAKACLVEKGIAADRITTVSKGRAEPVAPNTSEENRRKNRRILILVISD